ncbi:MAG: alpha/beta hydrolase [Myxococcota bacterium]|nr:alpha/beta hydrolase [Myxococcota bacterium]
MNVSEVGIGPTVMILHGSPSPLDDLWPLAQRLARTYNVICPALPGYGGTAPLADFSFDRTGDALAEVLRERDISHVRAIIGFSSGGYRALDLVLRRGIRCDLVVGLGALAAPARGDRELLRMAARSLRGDPTGAELRPLLPPRLLSERWRRDHPGDDARVRAWFDLIDPRHLADELDAVTELTDLHPLLPALKSSLDLRVGELDVACSPSMSSEMAGLAPRALVEIVPDCGHALLIEDATATIDRVTELVHTGL